MTYKSKSRKRKVVINPDGTLTFPETPTEPDVTPLDIPPPDIECSEPSEQRESPTSEVSVESECVSIVPDEPKEEEISVKKIKRKRKKNVDVSDGPEGEKKTTGAPPVKKSRKAQELDDFTMNLLPALKKDVKNQKKEKNTFNIRAYDRYFKEGSEWVATYSLNLFYFLGKSEILCTEYGCFNGKHMVKTIEGFNHATFITSSLKDDLLSSEEAEALMRRYGREWHKIPPKDSPKVSTAFEYGDHNQFKVILLNLYEDQYFTKGPEGNVVKVKTINPVYRYEAIRLPAPKEKKEKKSKKEKKEKEEEKKEEAPDSEIL